MDGNKNNFDSFDINNVDYTKNPHNRNGDFKLIKDKMDGFEREIDQNLQKWSRGELIANQKALERNILRIDIRQNVSFSQQEKEDLQTQARLLWTKIRQRLSQFE